MSTPSNQVCRIKNKFLLPDSEVQDGYRDIAINLLYTDADGLSIICEVQIHDKRLYELKCRMHKLYSVKRATSPATI